jgi:hypothetical protein
LIFKTLSDKPDFNNCSSKEYFSLHADVDSITLKVHLEQKIGEGSMRRAFKAEVKENMVDGLVEIFNYFAKLWYHDKYPTLSHHTSDALRYEGSAHFLYEFKKVLPTCRRLSEGYLHKVELLQVRFSDYQYWD